ncbi:MAG: FecR domain-containing protein [Spirochaetales bacterium]|uniref:FecR domain-containing protein n=1 Tax=Candidatus Thalassospirochaeta sargassi TaxID=3119039 RepID=A0AAJ1MIV3_9SPIO|nr:FecR domain-containing protein [Spirochaetales bacterium]
MKKLFFYLILLFFVVFSVTAGGQTEGSAAVPQSVDGTVEYFDGNVTVDGVQADFGMKVGYGAIVKTGADSYCEIVFDSKNIFRIMESTVAEIRLNVEAPEIQIEKGAFAALFTKLEKLTSNESLKVRTQTTVASIRGTAFFVKVLDPETTYVCLCNGELDLAEDDGSNAGTYSSGHHTAVYFKEADGETEVTDAPMLYHNDEDMDSLAKHIGEKINWYY